ncbi:hypothetical protein ASF46_03400 [Rathayibacter sp. Leaf296]|nr:hypothetical protein ASF46_03400 [Rathayibacter sp. Leaf296]
MYAVPLGRMLTVSVVLSPLPVALMRTGPLAPVAFSPVRVSCPPEVGRARGAVEPSAHVRPAGSVTVMRVPSVTAVDPLVVASRTIAPRVPHASTVYGPLMNSRVGCSDAAAAGVATATATTGMVHAAPDTIVRRWTPPVGFSVMGFLRVEWCTREVVLDDALRRSARGGVSAGFWAETGPIAWQIRAVRPTPGPRAL